jgi:pilus assembly protein CpaC
MNSRISIKHWPSPAALLRRGLFLLTALAALSSSARAGGQEPRTTTDRPLVTAGLDNGRLLLATGRSAVVNAARPIKRVSIADPDIATVNAVSPTSVLVTPKRSGATQLVLWDEQDRTQMIDVVVQLDMQALQAQLKALFPDSKIEAIGSNGTIVLRGRASNAQTADQAAQLASPYGKVLNLIEIAGGQQVMLQVRFAEISRSATNALGINGAMVAGSAMGGSNIGQLSPTALIPGANSLLGAAPAFQGLKLNQDQAPSPNVTLYGGGQLGSVYLEYFVQALRQNNLLRILAEPNLLAMSGEEADFLAGGSFPIPVAQGGGGSGGNSAITVEFRDFGVKLNFVPVVLGDGRIRLKVAPEVSDLDFTTAVRFNGFVIPGLSKRRVSTVIELGEGQTFAIAGLLSHNVTASKDVTPLLGDLPVIGPLFRSVSYARKETELIVLVTPHIVAPMNPGEVPPVPGEQWRHPSEKDLFLKTDLGGPVDGRPKPTTAPAAPAFYGQHGFVPIEN